MGKLFHQRIFYLGLFLIVLTVVLSVLVEPPSKPTTQGSNVEELSSQPKPSVRTDGGFQPLANACQNGFMVVALFLLIFGSLSVASETTLGTIRMILTRPFRRSELMLAKIIALCICAILMALLVDILSVALVQIRYGFGNVVDPRFQTEIFCQKSEMFRFAGHSFILVLLPLMTTGIFGLFISTLIENSGLAVALTLIIIPINYFVLALFPDIATYSFTHYTNYFTGALMDVAGVFTGADRPFRIIDHWLGLPVDESLLTSNLFPGWQWEVIKSIIIPISYTILLSILSIIIFKRKDVVV